MQNNNDGFTLVEAILLITVISVVMTLAFPDIISTFRYQRQYDEESQMMLVRKGLEAYVEVNLQLPPEDDNWGDAIAPFTPLSINEIECDSWNQPREYRMGTLGQNIAGEVFSIDYAIVYSYGENGCFGIRGVCNATNQCDTGNRALPVPNLPEATFDTDPADFELDQYANINAEEGDFLIKFTTFPQRVEAFEKTNTRLQRVSDALSNFSIEGYNNAVMLNQLNGATTMRDWNFYPPSGNDALNNYHQEQSRDRMVGVVGFNGGSAINATRRTYMIELMRVLGLPDDHCCNAMETFDAGGGIQQEVPFFYYSNPRPRIGGGCGARPAFGELKQPARIRVEADICG